MTEINAVSAIGAQTAALAAAPPSPAPPAAPATSSFGDLIAGGLHQVEERVNTANDMVRAFAVSDSVPVHQVTIALEQARLSVELALQVRTRLVDGFHEIMNMQL